jgi:uncharacterized protein YggU (UPF0235/DUF167 family)
MPLMTLTVQVKLRAHQSRLEKQPDGTWVAYLKSPPVDGQANEELIRLVARHWQVGIAQVHLRRGHRSRHKYLEVLTHLTASD